MSLRVDCKLTKSTNDLDGNSRYTALVVSYDHICTHIIAFEGESIAKIHIGNWSDYETMMMEKFGKDLQPHRVKYRQLKR